MIDRVLFVALPTRFGAPTFPACGPDAVTLRGPDYHVEIVRPAVGKVYYGLGYASLTNLGFNQLWATALNQRPAVTHFAMQHDDIRPAPDWADVLADELRRKAANVVSAVVPVKDERGITSTAVRDAATGIQRRLTMAEVMRLPETFDLDDVRRVLDFGHGPSCLLAVNTGLWACWFDAPWVREFPGFHSADLVRQLPDGRWVAVCLSEDWCFSEWLWRQGLRAVATRKTPLAHLDGDGTEFRNDRAWGTCATDPGDLPPA